MVTMRPTRAPALGDQLAAVLRDQIVRRHLQPGTHLVEDSLAAEYDVVRRRLVGNFPQGFSHIGLVNTAYNLSGATGPARQRAEQDAPRA